jgi:CxxC-x17-CxxC domain-containing protein
MKKLFKRKKAAEVPHVPAEHAELDVAGLMDTIQQQLASLEKKVDILINQSSGRPAERQFRGGRSFGNRSNFRERSLTKVICAECGKECEVPFKPTADRPVYCRDCFAKRKGESSFGAESREFSPKKKPFFRKRR